MLHSASTSVAGCGSAEYCVGSTLAEADNVTSSVSPFFSMNFPNLDDKFTEILTEDIKIDFKTLFR